MKTFQILLLAGLLPMAARAQDPQIMSKEAIRRIESHLPKIEPGFVLDAIRSKYRVWYDLESMGSMYQIGDGQNFANEFSATGRLGVANALLVVSGNNGGNLRFHFPWEARPGGTSRSPNVNAVKLFALPPKPGGGVYPIVIRDAELEGFLNPSSTVTGMDCIFPVGIVFLELIAVDDLVSKQHYVCAIRAAIRLPGEWGVEVMTQTRTALETRAEFIKLSPRWWEDKQLAAFIRHLGDNRTLQVGRLRDQSPGNTNFRTAANSAFDVTTKIDKLPPLNRELIAKFLDMAPLRASAGYEWKPGCTAPTTDEPFHVVPQFYDGAFCGNDSVSCAKCHDGVQISARRHDQNNDLFGWNGGWTERPISFNPVDPESLTRLPNSNIKIRQSWIDAGYVAQYDPKVHPRSVYHRLTVPNKPR